MLSQLKLGGVLAAIVAASTLAGCSSASTSPTTNTAPPPLASTCQTLRAVVGSGGEYDLTRAVICGSRIHLTGSRLRHISSVAVEPKADLVAVVGEGVTRDHVYLLHGKRGDAVAPAGRFIAEYNPTFDNAGKLVYVALEKRQRVFDLVSFDPQRNQTRVVARRPEPLFAPFAVGPCTLVPSSATTSKATDLVRVCGAAVTT